MADNRFSSEYNAGGLSYEDTGASVGSFGGALGRLWNNVSGTTAANQFSAAEAEKTRNYNSAEAQKNRVWQEYMSNTAYQRAVNDMKAAGINPAMAMSNGGASTPGGSAASAAAAHATAPGNGGYLGLAAKIALGSIAKGLSSKFGNTAMKAAEQGKSVSQAVNNELRNERANSAHFVANNWLRRF